MCIYVFMFKFLLYLKFKFKSFYHHNDLLICWLPKTKLKHNTIFSRKLAGWSDPKAQWWNASSLVPETVVRYSLILQFVSSDLHASSSPPWLLRGENCAVNNFIFYKCLQVQLYLENPEKEGHGNGENTGMLINNSLNQSRAKEWILTKPKPNCCYSSFVCKMLTYCFLFGKHLTFLSVGYLPSHYHSTLLSLREMLTQSFKPSDQNLYLHNRITHNGGICCGY